MVRGARYVYVGLAWAFLAGYLVQVFFIGLALFGSPEFREVHRNVGYVLSLVPIPMLLVAAAARVGRTRLLWALALAVVVFVFPIFPVLRDTPAIAALHPVGAVIGFAMAIVVGRGATSALREADGGAGSTGAPAG